MRFFRFDGGEEFVEFDGVQFFRQAGLRQLGCKGLDPIHDRGVVHLQQSADAPIIDPIDIHPDRLDPHFIGVATLLRVRRVLCQTVFAAVLLAPCYSFPTFSLMCGFATFWTFHNPYYLRPLNFTTPNLPRNVDV